MSKRRRVEANFKLKSLAKLVRAAIADEAMIDMIVHCFTILDVRLTLENLSGVALESALSLLEALPENTVLNREFWRTDSGQEIIRALSGEVLPSSQSSTASELDVVVSQEAFGVGFERQSTIVAPLVRYLNSCAPAWSTTVQYSPCVTVCNGSMLAKTRTILEIVAYGVFVFSICLRRPKSTGYPPRSAAVAGMLESHVSDKQDLMRDCCGLLIVSLQALTAWLKAQDLQTPLTDLTRAWLAHQTPEFWATVVARVSLICSVTGDKGKREQEYSKLMDEASVEFRKTLTTLANVNADRPEHLRVLFAFDEPSQLSKVDFTVSSKMTRFDYLRRSFRIFPPGSGILAVLSDTNSTVATLAPPSSKDPSLRAADPGVTLFAPFWQLATIDVWPKCRGNLTVRELEKLVNYSVYGRPGFHAIAQSEKGAATLLNVLMAKLVTDSSLNAISQNDALAVIGARTSLNVAASCQASSTLCSSHMRMCVGISKDRESVYTFQLPEPALAHAAMRILNRAGWAPFLQHLKSAVGAAFADPGYRGELAAQILLLMASDQTISDLKVLNDSSDLPAVPLISLLTRLIGEANVTADLRKHAANKYVRLAQFFQMFAIPSAQKLAELWKRSTAVVCKTNNSGCDLVIPVLCVEPEENVLDVTVEGQRMTVLALQVKCRSRPISANERSKLCGSGIQLSDCGVGLDPKLPFFCALLEMRWDKVVVVYPAKKTQQSFALVGLKPSDVMTVEAAKQSEIDNAFVELEKARYDPKTNPAHDHLSLEAKDAACRAFECNFGLAYD